MSSEKPTAQVPALLVLVTLTVLLVGAGCIAGCFAAVDENEWTAAGIFMLASAVSFASVLRALMP